MARSMGYCRFENAYMDLYDCNEHLWDDDLSEREEKYRKFLVRLCKEIAEDYELEEESN